MSSGERQKGKDQVRVLSGQVKGARLKGPRGSVRPTTSRVRQAIFNILPQELVAGARVLDAYAGTGALGIEGLSQGARWVDFVERSPALCRLIRENLKAAGLGDRGHVYCATMKKALAFLSEPYDLVLMDPPYAEGETAEVLAALATAGLLKDEGLAVVEHAARAAVPQETGALFLLRTRRYGDTAVSLYRQARAA